MKNTIRCILSLLSVCYSLTAAQITVLWDNPTGPADGVTSYRIYSLNPSRLLLTTVPAPTLTAVLTLAESSTTYVLVVRAVNSQGESGDSNQLLIKIVTPTAPGNFRRP